MCFKTARDAWLVLAPRETVRVDSRTKGLYPWYRSSAVRTRTRSMSNLPATVTAASMASSASHARVTC